MRIYSGSRKILFAVLSLILIHLGCQLKKSSNLQQTTETNFEAINPMVPQTIDPLKMRSGENVTISNWRIRRNEIIQLFEEHVYGRAPVGRPENMRFEIIESSDSALDDLAQRKQVVIYLTGTTNGPKMHLLIYSPKNVLHAVPAFLAINFQGNHTIINDPMIINPGNYQYPRMTKDRSSKWSIMHIISNGFALVTFHSAEIDPDFDDEFKNGIHKIFDPWPANSRPPNAWGTVATWAWGLSRAMDYIETDATLNSRQIAVLGHSRLGKTALWAGAQDERFALVISNNSGCTGAAYSRNRKGETVAKINQAFPHWFCENYHQFNDREEDLPVDQHLLIASIAPRPVYVASASDDLWADPEGEFYSCVLAEPVFQLHRKMGLNTHQFPEPNTVLHDGDIAYHLRKGAHDVTLFDWEHYIIFAKKYFK